MGESYRQTLARNAAWKREKRLKNPNRKTRLPFVGVDGEGGGSDELGRQNYLLLRAGDHVLFEGNRRLTSEECLDFITRLPTNRYYVAYYFDYDTAQILRDLPPDKLTDLMNRRVWIKHKRADTILWGPYEIGYFPRKHLKVRRVGSGNQPISEFVTIHDSGTFFQCSFHKACKNWEVLSEAEHDQIAAGKAAREGFTEIDQTIFDYNALECRALANLMERFREVYLDCGYEPKAWEGPGYLASAMMLHHQITRSKKVAEIVPYQLWRAANASYYGGRFEIFKTGLVVDVQEYDICSAYPYAYLGLPCLEHGQWDHHEGGSSLRLPETGLYLARIRFSHKEESPVICHLPIRLKSGSLIWPREGQGWYWSTEICQAIAAGTVVAEVFEIWTYKTGCQCRPFGDWVETVYKKRQALGKGIRGIPLKLALNSIYGKCCQSIGSPTYGNPIWASLITATIRAKLISGYMRLAPERLVMLATDGLYAIGGSPDCVPIGNELGDWEEKDRGDIFVVKPGMYAWETGRAVKTRGVPLKEFVELLPMMKSAFLDWLFEYEIIRDIPKGPKLVWPEFPFWLKVFYGIRLGLHRNKPELIGKWDRRPFKHSFDPHIKRRAMGVCAAELGRHIETLAHLGGPDLISEDYRKAIGGTPNDELHQLMQDVISSEEFPVKTASLDFAALISGLDDTQLFDDDDEEIMDMSEIE